MRYSAVYHISSPGISLEASDMIRSDLINGLETKFERAFPQNEPWSLSHHLLRSTEDPSLRHNDDESPAPGSPAPTQYSYHHLLHNSALSPESTYVYVQAPDQIPPVKAEPGPQTQGLTQFVAPNASKESPIVTIPKDQTETHFTFLSNFMGALWTVRHILKLQNGVSYSGAMATVRLGELRANRQGQAAVSHGVVVWIATDVGKEEDEAVENADNQEGDKTVDFSIAEDVIRHVWSNLSEGKNFGKGKTEVREYMLAREDSCGNKRKEAEATVRMLCEALRMRRSEKDQPRKSSFLKRPERYPFAHLPKPVEGNETPYLSDTDDGDELAYLSNTVDDDVAESEYSSDTLVGNEAAYLPDNVEESQILSSPETTEGYETAYSTQTTETFKTASSSHTLNGMEDNTETA